MSNVYIVQTPYRDKDLSSAHRYGDLRFIFEDSRFQPSLRPGVAQKLIQDSLEFFDPDEDYILSLGGDWVGQLMVGQYLAAKFPGRDIKILRWERQRALDGERQVGAGYYVPSIVRS